MKKCTICNKEIMTDDAPILVMGAYGNPKLLCEECSADLDLATGSADYTEIAEAMERLGEKITANEPDPQTLSVVNSILEGAGNRAKEIREGTYDFSLDEESESDESDFEEIPDELMETEEDKEQDRIDEEKEKQFDKIFSWVSLGILVGLVGFVIWKILDAYLF